MTAQGKQGKFYQRLNSTWFKFKFLNCGAEILVCVSWLSETPGQGSNAEFWQWHKTKLKTKKRNEFCLCLSGLGLKSGKRNKFTAVGWDQGTAAEGATVTGGWQRQGNSQEETLVKGLYCTEIPETVH